MMTNDLLFVKHQFVTYSQMKDATQTLSPKITISNK